MTQEGPFLKVPEVAVLLRTDATTVRRRIREGELEATKPCGQYLVTQAALERFLERARVRVTQTPPAARPQRTEPVLPAPPTGRAPGGSFRSRLKEEAA
ncbi:MAG TPA: helix-turn-helix domain-containing protein [Solirubrobacter sp.]|nr:helix-turn-helix domain-containing protein [Solirubrobacter sp.]